MNEQNKSFIDQLTDYFQENPQQYGWVLILAGIVLLYGSIKKWDWIFEGDGTLFNIAWVAQTFGFRTAQALFILLSLLFVALGAGWLLLY